MPLRLRVYYFLYDLDVAVNQLGGGRDGETISGTIGRAVQRGERWAPFVARVVDWCAYRLVRQTDHCKVAAGHEELRRNWKAAHPDPYA
jgi:hypothetical protein